MRRPQPAEEYIIVVIVVDNKGCERIQHVEYIVTGVRGDTVYVTADGLAYARNLWICGECPNDSSSVHGSYRTR